MRSFRIPLLAALVGGVVVALTFLLVGGTGTTRTTTIVEQAPVAAKPAAATGSLTPGEIYRRVAPGVVFIRSDIVQEVPSPFGFPQDQRGTATGSGFVIDGDGRILTNFHVIAGASKVTVKFADDETVTAKVLGTDPSKDLALLKVDPGDVKKLAPVPLGESSSVRVGDPVLALGNPFGLDRTLTSGIVSALQRSIEAPNGFRIDDVIQTDAAINPGNSGGPLLNGRGQVIGINSQIATGGSGSEGNVGIGFAVPINAAKRDLPELEQGRVERAWLGVSIADVTPDENLAARDGALVRAVVPGSPAAKAGLRGTRAQANGPGRSGDIIVAADGKPVRSADDLTSAVSNRKPGDTLSLAVVRDGERKTIDVTLATQPARAPSQ